MLLKRQARMQYFVWYDDNPNLTLADKIHAAVAAYVARFSANPNLVLVNVAHHVVMPNVTVRSVRTVPPNTFWVGVEVGAEPQTV
jgi:hypothetical protein